MATLPKLKTSPLKLQLKKSNHKCTINSLTNTLKKLIPNIKEIQITSKKIPKEINKKLYIEQVLKPLNKKGLKTQVTSGKDKGESKGVEFYPDRQKRKICFNKIVLKPRHDYIVVAATNKRKRCTPVKDAGSLKKPKTDTSSTSNDLSFEDMIPSSIIHKIHDLNSKTAQENEPITVTGLTEGPTTDPDLSDWAITAKCLKNASVSVNDPKNPPITDKNISDWSITATYLNNGHPTAADLKNGPSLVTDYKKLPHVAKKNNQILSDFNLGKKVPKKITKSGVTDLMDQSGRRELRMEDLMNDENLTDEDFMEILTCPSPVWWEDPPDENFVEEPIGIFINQDNGEVSSKTNPRITQNKKETSKLPNTPNIEQHTSKNLGNKALIEKRLKLENLLSDMKNNFDKKGNPDQKTSNKIRKVSSDSSELGVSEENLLKSLESIKIPIKNSNPNANTPKIYNTHQKKKKILRKTAKNRNIRKKNEIKENTEDCKFAYENFVDTVVVKQSKINANSNNNTNNIETTKITVKTEENKSETMNTTAVEKDSLTNTNIDNKTTSPRKSNRISPKKHHLTKYYNLKSRCPRIIKQNSRNKIIIENSIKIDKQATPEKKNCAGNVSKIKKAYLDLLQNNKIENIVNSNKNTDLNTKIEINTQTSVTTEINTQESTATDINKYTDGKTTDDKIKTEINTEENTVKETNTDTNDKTTDGKIKTEINTDENIETDTEINTKQNSKTIEINKKENYKIQLTEHVQLETINNNKKSKNSKLINNIPTTLPKLTKIPQNLVAESPKSIKSVTSDSTDLNSELDTISDTNIHYIDEYDEKNNELVTVYQIISKHDNKILNNENIEMTDKNLEEIDKKTNIDKDSEVSDKNNEEMNEFEDKNSEFLDKNT